METLVKTLKANVNIDIPRLGVLPLSLKNEDNYVKSIRLYSPKNFEVKCISGTLYKDSALQTVELSAGDKKTYKGGDWNHYFNFAAYGEVVIEIYNMYDMAYLHLQYVKFTPALIIKDVAKFTSLTTLTNSTNTLSGRLEEYISRAAKYGKTSNITITNSWVYFGANREMHGTTYFCDFETDSNVVTIKDTNSSGSVLGTYNKSTGVWTYASA